MNAKLRTWLKSKWGRFTLSVVVLLGLSVGEHVLTRSDFYLNWVPGGYRYSQGRLRELAAREPLDIQLVDMSHLKLIDSTSASGAVEADEEDRKQFLKGLQEMLQQKPRRIIIDADLFPERIGSGSTSPQDSLFASRLDALAESAKSTRIIVASFAGTAQDHPAEAPNLWTGQAHFPNSTVRFGVHWWYPIRRMARPGNLPEYRVPQIMEILGHESDPPHWPGLEADSERFESDEQPPSVYEYGLLNYAASLRMVEAAVPFGGLPRAGIRDKTLILGDISNPTETDRAYVPDLPIHGGIGLLSSAVYTHLYARIATVREDWGIFYGFVFAATFAVAAAALRWLLKRVSPKLHLPHRLAHFLEVYGVAAFTIAFSIWFFGSYLVANRIIMEGVLVTIVFQIVEVSFHLGKHTSHQEEP